MSRTMNWFRLTICLCLLSTTATALAQDESTNENQPSENSAAEAVVQDSPAQAAPGLQSDSPVVQESSQVDPAAATEMADEEAVAKWDRLIYVPFRELRKVFDQSDASVVLPYAEYLELMKAYLASQQIVNGKSPDAVVTETNYQATIEKDVVRIKVQLKLNILKQQGWSAVPLSFGKAAVGSIEADEGNVLLQGVGPGQYQLLVQGSGIRNISIDLLATVRTSPDTRSFQIQCPPAGISHLTVTIPEADQTVTISPVQVLLPTEEEVPAGMTVVRASLGATDQFEVRWNARAGTKPVMDLLASATNTTETRIEPGLLQIRTVINYEILRGELREVSLLAPLDSRIIDVVSSGGRIRAWTAEPAGETHQVIRIELLSPISDRFQVEVQTERNPEGDTFQLIGKSEDGRLQGVHADAVVRESGRLTVIPDPALTTIVKQQSGLKQVDVGSPVKGSTDPSENGSRQAWEFSGQTGRLVLQTRPVEPRLLVQHDAQIVFTDNELRLRSVLSYSVERAGVFQLALTIPSSLTVDRVSADGMSEFHVDKESGRITLSLTQKRMGAIAVTVHAHQAFDSTADSIETELPSIAPEGAERETGTLTVYAPQFLDVSTVEEKLVGLFAARDAQVPTMARQRHIASWSFTRRPIALFVLTSPRPAQLAATVGTTARVEPDIVKLNSVVSFEIQNAGIDTLRLAVPEAVASDVRFSAASPGHIIQQRTRAAQAEDGWVTWTLVLQDETTGSVSINVDWEVTPETAAIQPTNAVSAMDAGGERSFVLQPPRVLTPFTAEQAERRRVTLTQARGEMRLLRHESLSITAEEQGDAVEAIDVRELELLPQDGYLAFRYYAQPASAVIRIRKHEIHEVVATVVSRAAVEIVTEKQALAAYRWRLRIVTSERQRLRVDLPADSELQAPLLNGQRTTIERATDVTEVEAWDAYYVNISREQTSDQEFLLTFQFRCPIVAGSQIPYERYGGTQILRLPVVGDDRGTSVVQQTQLAIWAPKDISFLGEPNRWTQIGRSDFSLFRLLESPNSSSAAAGFSEWIGDASGGAGDFAAQGHASVFRAVGRQDQIEVSWRSRPFLLWLISGTLVLVGLILRRTSWENRITILLLVALAAGLWAMNDAYTSLQFLTAALPGGLVVAAIWIAGLLFGPRGNHRMEANSSGGNGSGSRADSGPSDRPLDPAAPAPAVAPSPEVTKWMNDLMEGK